ERAAVTMSRRALGLSVVVITAKMPPPSAIAPASSREATFLTSPMSSNAAASATAGPEVSTSRTGPLTTAAFDRSASSCASPALRARMTGHERAAIQRVPHENDRRAVPQLSSRPAQLRHVSLDRCSEIGKSERLLQVIVGTVQKRLPLVLPLVQRRHHDDAHGIATIRRRLPNEPAHLPSALAPHHHVEKHNGRLRLPEHAESFIASVCDGPGIATHPELVAHYRDIVAVVVHHQRRWQPSGLTVGHGNLVVLRHGWELGKT